MCYSIGNILRCKYELKNSILYNRCISQTSTTRAFPAIFFAQRSSPNYPEIGDFVARISTDNPSELYLYMARKAGLSRRYARFIALPEPCPIRTYMCVYTKRRNNTIAMSFRNIRRFEAKEFASCPSRVEGDFIIRPRDNRGIRIFPSSFDYAYYNSANFVSMLFYK